MPLQAFESAARHFRRSVDLKEEKPRAAWIDVDTPGSTTIGWF